MRPSIPAIALIATLAATGCKAVDPAPADVDGLLHWFLTGWDEADDAAIAEAFANTHEAVGGETLEEAFDGSATTLTEEEIAFSGRDDVDPGAARGMFLANTFACDLDQLERVLKDLDQDELYPVYEAYERTYTSDPDAYLVGEAPALTWDVHIEGKLLGAGYSEEIEGGLRRIPDTPFGDALLTRTFMTEPADFGDSSAKDWPQDWQVEAYYERAPGEIVHLYGVWREMRLGAGLTTDDDGVVRIILNNLADWDDQTEVLCAEGRP